MDRSRVGSRTTTAKGMKRKEKQAETIDRNSTSWQYLPGLETSRPRTSQIPRSTFGLQPSLLTLSQALSSTLPQSASSPSLSKDLFPDWLTSRKDFQDVRTQYERLDNIDCFLVCSKPFTQRTAFETQAVVKLMRSCPFFVSMKDYQLRTISQRFHAVSFRTNQKIIVKGEKADCLYLIVTGRVGIYIEEGVVMDEVIERNVIGETAINTRSIRTATVIAHCPVKALRLTYEDYDLTVFKIKLMDFQAVSGFLRSLEHFRDWNVAKLYRLASITLAMQYKQGQTLYSIGESAHDLYVIQEGQVEIKVEIEVERTNRWPVRQDRWQEVRLKRRFEKTLRVCGKGDFFGEQELLGNKPRRATAICKTDCIIFIIKDEFYREIFSEREKRTLCAKFNQRPDTPQLRISLETEKKDLVQTTEAMLNGLNTNSLPNGRESFTANVSQKRLKWARLLVNRRKNDLRRDLLSEEKSQREIRSMEEL